MPSLVNQRRRSARERSRMTPMTAEANKRAAAIRVVIPFVLHSWLNHSPTAATVAGGLLGATVADLFMPLFSGHLVDAVTLGASDPAARRAAFTAFCAIVALSLVSMTLRLVGLQAIVPFTLRIMSDASRDAFMRVQRFSTDWHANSFAGSTVRKVTRGVWALDLLNDTILMALLPSLAVLLGSMILLGLHWSSLGLVIAVGALIYVSMTVVFSTRYIAPAARISNAWDTKVGGTLADALTCNAVVKSFSAEAREDARLARVVSRWRGRVRRTWLRYNYTATAQLAVLLCLRASVIGGSLLLWMAGRASPGGVTYLFHPSLAENIAYGRPGASMAAIEQAARLANAHEFILRLPKGSSTLVGERGVKLSGGERQRVALARAFLA